MYLLVNFYFRIILNKTITTFIKGVTMSDKKMKESKKIDELIDMVAGNSIIIISLIKLLEKKNLITADELDEIVQQLEDEDFDDELPEEEEENT